MNKRQYKKKRQRTTEYWNENERWFDVLGDEDTDYEKRVEKNKTLFINFIKKIKGDKK